MAAIEANEFLRLADLFESFKLPRGGCLSIVIGNDHRDRRRRDAREKCLWLVATEQVETAQGELVDVVTLGVVSFDPFSSFRTLDRG